VKKSIKDLVKDEGWQKIRKELLGQWSKKPTWCCYKLGSFLGTMPSASEDKLRIVMNYLTGTGFRTGRIKHSCIQKLRDGVSKELKRRKE
jgi:hypothetical protein